MSWLSANQQLQSTERTANSCYWYYHSNTGDYTLALVNMSVCVLLARWLTALWTVSMKCSMLTGLGIANGRWMLGIDPDRISNLFTAWCRSACHFLTQVCPRPIVLLIISSTVVTYGSITRPTADSDWGCFRGCAISSSLGAPFWMYHN